MSDDWTNELEDLQAQIDALRASIDYTAAARRQLVVPDSAEFILSPDYLAQTKIYPRQLSLMRVIRCELDNLTPFDHSVIDEWESGFVPGAEAGAVAPSWMPAPDQDYTKGTPGDIRERMAEMRRQGRHGFREVNMVCGRRAGKGHVGSLLAAMVVWSVIALGDPQKYFGIPPSKRIQIPIFAGNREQARWNLFADIVALIVHAPCFAPYIVSLTKDRLILATPADLARADRHYDGTVEIVAKETTMTAGRGPGTIAQFYDEMAFIEPATSNSSAEELYSAATPALDQFGEWATLWSGSSPYHQTGEFYAIHCRAREIDRVTGKAAFPEILTLQAPSWGLYEDCENAEELSVSTEAEAARVPCLQDGEGRPRCFPPTGRPISAYDDQMRQLERARSAQFRVERLAQWATVLDAFLEPHEVDRLFAPYKGTALTRRDRGILRLKYVIAVDPAARRDAFTWVVGHPESDDEGHPHVVVDLARRWLPADYDHELPLDDILDRLVEDIRAFRAEAVILDQYGGDFVRQGLNQRLYSQPRTGRSVVIKKDRTRGRNLHGAAVLREALQLGHVHCYPEPQLGRELRFLRETPGGVAAPTSGPVQTDDLAIALMVLVEHFLGEAAEGPLFEALGDTRLGLVDADANDPITRLHNLSRSGRNMRGTRRQNPRRGLPPYR